MTRVITEEDAIAVAQRRFVKGRNTDMESIAHDLAVGRATLYRVVGSRDRLLGLMLARMGRLTLRDIRRKVSPESAPGISRILTIAHLYNATVMEFEPLRRFMREEPDTCLRVLFSERAETHLATVDLFTDVIEAEVASGSYTPSMAIDRLAYHLVRIGESEVWAPLLTNTKTDLNLCIRLHHALLTLPSLDDITRSVQELNHTAHSTPVSPLPWL